MSVPAKEHDLVRLVAASYRSTANGLKLKYEAESALGLVLHAEPTMVRRLAQVSEQLSERKTTPGLRSSFEAELATCLAFGAAPMMAWGSDVM